MCAPPCHKYFCFLKTSFGYIMHYAPALIHVDLSGRSQVVNKHNILKYLRRRKTFLRITLCECAGSKIKATFMANLYFIN